MSKNQEWVSQNREGGEERNPAGSGRRRQPEKENRAEAPEGVIRGGTEAASSPGAPTPLTASLSFREVT